jgi:Thioredoxin-like
MKTPRFEELAQRWAGKAQVFIVYSEEAHPRAAAFDRLVGFAGQLQSLDKDKDNAVTLAEFGSIGPRFMFDAFDLDHDGIVRAHELLAARRIDQFRTVDEPKTYEERVTLARRFRAEVPGSIPVLVDPIDNRTAKAYGELPNSAYVIGRDGRVAAKFGWASVTEVEGALARMTGAPPPVVEKPDLAVIAPALESGRRAGKRVLLELVSPGCEACRVMDETTLADPGVKEAMTKFEVVKLGIEHDTAWRLFEQLDLASTPAFVVIEPDGTVGTRVQGMQDRAPFLAFLR